MGATASRHALIIRVQRLALAGVTGIWLWGGGPGTGPALAGEPGGASPRPAHAQMDGPAPVPAARRTVEPYVFFLGDGRTTHHPAKTRVQAAPAPDRTSRAYLFFVPGKKIAARTPAPAVGPTSPIPAPGPSPGPGPKPAAVGVAVAEEGLPLPPGQRGLIFFPPKEITAKPGHPPVTNLAARPNLRMPTLLAAVERVPVRLPGTPARRRHPYLIFQPKPVRDRPSSSPNAKGTSSSAMPPALNVVVAVHTPPVGLETKPVAMPINPLEVPALGREPSIDPADLPPRPVVPAPPPAQKTVGATMLPPVRLDRTPGRIARDPSVGIVGNRQPLRKP